MFIKSIFLKSYLDPFPCQEFIIPHDHQSIPEKFQNILPPSVSLHSLLFQVAGVGSALWTVWNKRNHLPQDVASQTWGATDSPESVKNTPSWDFPGGPVVRTQHLHCTGLGSIPGRGTKVPQATRYGPKQQHNPKPYPGQQLSWGRGSLHYLKTGLTVLSKPPLL